MDVVIYHDQDPDGNFSAAIVLKKYPNCRTIGYNYGPDFGSIIPLCIGKNVCIVDVSPNNWQDMFALCDVATHVTWIDHHATALKEAEECEIMTHEKFTAIFEHAQRGACYTTWVHFFPEILIPLCVYYVSAHDVSRGYGTHHWNNYFLPFRFAVDHLDTPQKVLENFNFENYDIEPWLSKGRAIAEYFDYQNARLVHNSTLCYETRFNPDPFSPSDNPCVTELYKVLAMNVGLFGDQFKSRDTTEYAFLVCFTCHVGKWKVSLRGTGKDIDLGQIAKKFGGGGHKNAAGFTVATFQQLQKILMIY